jgi:deazaflavin-dependent oxidoreductase (nitroreductase family)
LPQRLAWDGFTRLHTAVFRATGGRLGSKLGRLPCLLLNHVGRKSGKQRTTPLLYIEDGADLVIVASKGGSPKHPAWWLNLRERPETTVELRGETRAVRAREAAASEKTRLWPRLVEVWPDYDKYQQRTNREIPVVILTPRR